MDRMHLHLALHPLPDIGPAEFERAMAEQVMPAVDMDPTRGGQIVGQSLLSDGDRGYTWVVEIDTMGGFWVDMNLQAARERLRGLAVTCSESEQTVVTATASRG